ncbi:MAG: diguanylate cyclase [Thermomonas sp.]
MPEAQEAATPPAVEISLVPSEQGIVADAETVAARNGRLLFSGGAAQRHSADLQFELPSASDERWVLWMSRDPLDQVQVSGLDDIIQSSGFYTPSADEGLIPTGYAFALSTDAVGHQRLRVELQGAIRSAPTPRILSEQQALRIASHEFALACVIYAALVTLLVASLVLYPAVRDPMFLLYSGYLAMALLLVATVSGHLYALPGGGGLGGMGARGFWLVVLAFNAVALLALTRFAETHASQSAWIRRLDRVAMVTAGLVLLPLVPLNAVADSLQSITTAAWILALSAGFVATVDGARRGVQMTIAAFVALLLLLGAAVAYEIMQRGWIGDAMLVRHGYQLALVLLSVIMFVGLGTRIGKVRQRLEDETSARLKSELHLHQERTRAGFAQVVHERLRGLAEDEIAPAAFRLLAEHARQMTGADAAVVVGSGYLGHDLLLVKPDGQAARFAQEIRIARDLVRAHSYNPEPMHVRIDGAHATDTPDKPLRVIIPIRLAAPAWAALVIPVSGTQEFQQAMLSGLAELSRAAVVHADQAYAALQLRRTAEHDSLTGAQNRHSLDKALAREFKAHGAHEAPLAVLFIDIDWFKRVNDRLGHACGDLCIRSIAECLRGELRPTDAMGRYGGDEFLVLLPGRDAAAARIIAERLRKIVEANQVYWEGEALPLTVSIGMAARRETDLEPGFLLQRADKALYAAKHEGRNRVCVSPAVFG